MFVSHRHPISSLGIIALLLATATTSLAQDDQSAGLSRILQGLDWGGSHQDVLDHYRAMYLDDYQAEIAGLRDAIEIDRVRRSHDARYQRVVDSYEVFEEARTGYEVSVLGGEIAGANSESMLTARTDNAILYYAFYGDQLFKIVVAYNSSYLGGLEFESFLDQLEGRYGPPDSTEVDETATGVRYLARALWEDDDTRLRVENRSNLFGTFVMVFTEPTLEDNTLASRTASGEAQAGVQVSDRVRQLMEGGSSAAEENIADQIVGSPTVVELQVPEEAPLDIVTPEDSQPMADPAAAEAEAEAEAEEEEEDEEAAAAARRREREREREREEEREEEEEEGITIY